MVEVVFENFVNYLRSGNTDKLNIISFQQNQQHKINLSTQLIFYRILTKTVVQLSDQVLQPSFGVSTIFESLQYCSNYLNLDTAEISCCALGFAFLNKDFEFYQ
ncbi:Hypothetical_protein [Hexamita inflata]|uniref:Hypothetical_protein n=1 Tax=Hexamita inflata TaxID=28002 RepID=A0AA86QLK1_9EUKA|nr:Hypothetical protein HINF_LOCUS43029 [Hexamita inflata]